MKKAFTFHYLDNFCPQTEFKTGSKDILDSIPNHNWRKLPPPKGRCGVRGQQAFTKAFTLAEVLITLAIIGVVAAIAIPSVISNAQQQEFKTGLRKAVSVLNSAITMNIALDGESPYDNHDLFRYLQRHMRVMSSTTSSHISSTYIFSNGQYTDGGFWGNSNSAFYTTDGMRFEFFHGASNNSHHTNGFQVHGRIKTHESGNINILTTIPNGNIIGCGSYGLANNPNNTTKLPCLIAVDVNGDRKPFPVDVNVQNNNEGRSKNKKVIPAPNSKKYADIFPIMITDEKAVPFGVVAQKAMYQAQK